MDKQGKPVDVLCTSAFKHDGQHIEVGQVITGMASDLAIELAGNGRVRLAKEEDVAAWNKTVAKRKAIPTKPEPGTST